MPDATASAPEAARPTIAAIDGNSLMHRAYHAIMQPMSAPDGRATNALFGFFNMFIKLVETFHPDGVVCAFDKGRPQVRIDMLPQYKAQRPPMDPALHEQFPMVKELLRALDVPVCECEGWEGDDILGTLARMGEQQGYDMYLFTGDRDMYQLATDHVKIVSTKKGVSDVAVMTPESVDDLYHGITPALVPDFYGLKGDTSDNIPGVPGIGPKKAAALIAQFGSLDGVVAHADEVKGKMGENLRAHIDDALLSRKVATILTDAPIQISLADAKFPSFDPGEVTKAFSALGFTGMISRILELGDEDHAEGAAEAAMPEVLSGNRAKKALEQAIEDGGWIGAAFEDSSASGKKQMALDFGDAGQKTVWLSVPEGLVRLTGDDATSALADIVRRGALASGDAKALLHLVCPIDSAEPALVEASGMDPRRIFDVGVSAYLLHSEGVSYLVRDIFARFMPQALPEPDEDMPAAALDAYGARLLVDTLETKMQEDECAQLFSELEMPLLPVLLQMERTGLFVDPAELARQSAELGSEISDIAGRIHAAAGEDFNIDSTQQLSHVLFDVLKLPTAGLKKTRSGFYSTNAAALADLAPLSPVVQDVLDYRERRKIRSTYLEALPSEIRGDGRIHTTLNQTVAATGRLSSSDPNLQNIPTRSEIGHRVRTAFTVPEGSVFLACDYSQIELRLLAHLSGDEHLVEAFRSGADFHRATAARVFGVPFDEVTPAQRSRAKAVNFGIVYGQQAFGLATSLNIPRAEAQQMIDRYFEVYPRVRQFLDWCIANARETGYAVTAYGRRRYTPDIKSSNFQRRSFAERTAMNHPMQGTAADIIKMAMVQVPKRIEEEGLASRLVLQIHDELDFEVPEREIEALSSLVKETMEGVAELRVPLIADVSYGSNWAEAK